MKTSALPLWTIFRSAQIGCLRHVTSPLSLDVVRTADFPDLIAAMVKTMYQANGIGLAAPQIGQELRLAIIAPEVDPKLHTPLVLINPIIADHDTTQEEIEEGCLSIPGVFGLVPRSATLTLTTLNLDGQPVQLTAHGMLARVIQHETDHLNGRLFIDRATRITRGQHLLP